MRVISRYNVKLHNLYLFSLKQFVNLLMFLSLERNVWMSCLNTLLGLFLIVWTLIVSRYIVYEMCDFVKHQSN